MKKVDMLTKVTSNEGYLETLERYEGERRRKTKEKVNFRTEV